MITRQAPAPQASVWTMSLAQARRRLSELESERGAILRAMEDLVQRFGRTFTPPWPAHPVLQRVAQGRVYLRWRMRGRNGRQPYVDLAGESGRALLQSLPVEVRQAFVRYAREAACLNLAHSLRQGEWLRLRQFLVECEALRASTGLARV